jgi:hypothetical protein
MTAQYLRVIPHEQMGDAQVPVGDGRRIARAGAPARGYLVPDSHFVRRRIHFGELVLLAEGPAAVLEDAPEAAAPAQPAAAAPARPKAAAGAAP